MIPETVRGKLDYRRLSLDEVKDSLTYFDNWDLVGNLTEDDDRITAVVPISRNRFENARRLFEDWYVDGKPLVRVRDKTEYKDGCGGLLLKVDYVSDKRTAVVSSPYAFEVEKFLNCIQPITDAEKIERCMIEKAPTTVNELIDRFNKRSVMNTVEDLENRGKAYLVKSGGKTYALHSAVFPEPYSNEGMKVLKKKLQDIKPKRDFADEFALRAAYMQELSEKSEMIDEFGGVMNG